MLTDKNNLLHYNLGGPVESFQAFTLYIIFRFIVGVGRTELLSILVSLMFLRYSFCSCAILVVSHGDPLQILQTILNAAKQHTGSSCNDIESIIEAIRTPAILSRHRKFALDTGELRAVI